MVDGFKQNVSVLGGEFQVAHLDLKKKLDEGFDVLTQAAMMRHESVFAYCFKAVFNLVDGISDDEIGKRKALITSHFTQIQAGKQGCKKEMLHPTFLQACEDCTAKNKAAAGKKSPDIH